MTTQKSVLIGLTWLIAAGGSTSPPVHATTPVYDKTLIKPYTESKRNCLGMTPLPNECRFPRSYRVRLIEGLTHATELNNVGQVVGQPTQPSFRPHVGVWSKGRVSDLGILGCRQTVSHCFSLAGGINDYGQVVGSSTDDNSHGINFAPYYPHAFVWSAGNMSRLPELGPEWSHATDINNNGVIVGYGRAVPDYLEHGWINVDGMLTVIGDYGEAGRAYAVNESNQVVGNISFGGFMLSGGTMTILGTLGTPYSYAYDINDAPTPNVVGESGTANYQRHGFLWRPGVMFDLGTLPGATSSVARAINNRGQIVGQSGNLAVVWQNGVMREINHYLPTNAPRMSDALDIDKRGKILAKGQDGAYYLLNPQY